MCPYRAHVLPRHTAGSEKAVLESACEHTDGQHANKDSSALFKISTRPCTGRQQPFCPL